MHHKIFQGRGHNGCLRNARRASFSTVLTLFCCLIAGAQSYPNHLAADSVHPSLDSVIIRDMRERMDSVHRTQHRPTVALVLSGGGAKGAAHVGVLKFLEELDMPVDMVCGTSMGGLVGGLYSLGYSPAFLDSLLRAQDWSVTLTDKIDQKYISYADRMYKETYALSIPFHYKNEDFSTRILEQEKYNAGGGTLHMEADQGELNTQMGMNTIASSLPSGYVYGFNVNNLLSSLSVGYQDSISFRDLPLPFFCVASDIVSCKAKNWGGGNLKTAMRSTMSIPGMFDPVRTQGMILVDGGTRNNFPVDLARQMGADLVIGVDLSDINPSYSQVNNLGDILSQFITMLGKDAFDRNQPEVDVFIKPELSVYNMLSFNAEAISNMIWSGYSAAKDKEEELRELKRYMKNASKSLCNTPATDINTSPVIISEVLFDGVTDDESLMLQEKIDIKVGSFVSKSSMDRAMSQIFATQAFESVTYSLLGESEPYRLVFNCVKAPTHRLGLGVRADSEDLVSLLLNIGLNSHNLTGSKIDFTAKIGQNQYGDFKYSLDLKGLPTINAEFAVSYNRNDFVEPSSSYDVGYWGHRELFYFSNLKWRFFDLQAGIRNDYMAVTTGFPDLLGTFDKVEPDRATDLVSLMANGHLFTMNKRYYPTKGQDLALSYQWYFIQTGINNGFEPAHVVSADYSFVIPFGGRVALIPDLHARQIIGGGETPNMFMGNYAGGNVPGRWISQQAPFVGVSEVIPLLYDRLMVTANANLRVNPLKSYFVSLKGGYLNAADSPVDLLTDSFHGYWGAALELGFNSLAGPISADIHWSNLTGRFGFYVSAGFSF